MSTLRAFPFRTADESLAAELRHVAGQAVKRSDGSWDLYTNDEPKVRFCVHSTIGLDQLEATLPQGETAVRDCSLVVLARGVASRRREIIARRSVGAGGEFEFDISRNDHCGRLDLLAAVVRNNGRREVDGFADSAGAILAQTDLPSLWFDEPRAPTGSAIEITWVDFTKDGTLPDKNMFALRLNERPLILLNSGIPFAYTILASKGTHGAAARIRDAIFAQIVHQVWTSLLAQCFMSVLRVGQEEPATTLERVSEWESQVLTDWAPGFYPSESDANAAVNVLIEELLTSGSTLLVERVADVIQTRMETIRGFNGLVRESDRFSGEVNP